MQRLRKIIRNGAILWIVFLTSCSHFYRVKPLIQSTLYLKDYPADPFCMQRCYSLAEAKTVAPDKCGIDWTTDKSWLVPMGACHGTVGFHYEDWAREIIPKAKANNAKIARLYADNHEVIEELLEADNIEDDIKVDYRFIKEVKELLNE